jgi:ABC-type hemin transport system substrate-binding protein
MRVVSCVPSLTEWIWDLGGSGALVGRTKFCVHPRNDIKQVPHIGGTKTLNVEAIEALQPDIVIANREENDKAQIEACATFSNVLVTEIRTVTEAWAELARVADAIDRKAEGAAWIEKIRQAWGEPRPVRERVAYCVWREPRMVAGGDTYISDVLRWWGAENAFAGRSRYPEVSPADWAAAGPDRVLLPSEPFPFKPKHVAEFEAPATLVDGEAFSWYGSRMWHAVDALRHFGG